VKGLDAAKSNEKTEQQLKLEELVCKLREIQVGLKNSLTDLQQKLGMFDSEDETLEGLENAKRDAETRASKLEKEVKELREELKSIKDFLDSNLDKK
jgi:chromosome segregation ATPase